MIFFVCWWFFLANFKVYILALNPIFQRGPYNDDNTASRLLSEVKHRLARLVLRWGTTLESRVLSLLPFCSFCSFDDNEEMSWVSCFMTRDGQILPNFCIWELPTFRLEPVEYNYDPGFILNNHVFLLAPSIVNGANNDYCLHGIVI
jgi:hypothetical protein